MKKFLIILISSFNFANFLNQDFKVKITENDKEYILKYENDNFEIEILKPNINKGERYIYKDNTKYIYYPKYDQTVKQNFTNEDNDIVYILKNMKKINKTTVINNKKYIVENGNIVSIKDKNYTIDIEYNKKNMPSKIILNKGNDKKEYLWTY